MDVGVQAGDDLIKVTMDRVKLQEKQKQIFLARDTSAPGGDKFIKPGGVFSPMAKHNKNSVVMMEEILGDIGQDDRVMEPSIRQRNLSAAFNQQQAMYLEALNQQYREQIIMQQQ